MITQSQAHTTTNHYYLLNINTLIQSAKYNLVAQESYLEVLK